MSIINAASCSHTDINAAIAIAITGDTVKVPACTFTLTGSVAVDKDLILEGAGKTLTILTCDVNNNHILLGNHNVKFRGFKLTASSCTGSNPFLLQVEGDNWRAHDNKFECTQSGQFTNGVWVYGQTRGVHPTGLIDLNEFIDARILVYGPNTDEWTTDFVIGNPNQDKVVYSERNTFTFSTSGGTNYIDGELGSQYVSRFNTIVNSGAEVHSMFGAPGGRNGRTWEIYKESASSDNGFFAPAFIRGGTGVSWGNTYSGYSFNNSRLDNRRSFESPGGVDGPCDGDSAWDENTPTENGHRCSDQIGTGNDSAGTFPQPQAHMPAYFWNNTNTPSVVNCGSAFKPNGSCDDIVSDRDYYVATGVNDGSSGVGVGTSLPSTCTIGVGFWKTNEGSWNTLGGEQGVLYKCTSTNVWTLYYTPYTYPHPLSLLDDFVPPSTKILMGQCLT